MSDKPKIGISSCLLGELVRYDGGHKRFGFCTEVLAEYVEFVSLCPEMGIGLGAPRPTIRLVKGEAETILARSSDGRELSEDLKQFAHKNQPSLDTISGYIFCAKSPSCGMERVPVYRDDKSGGEKVGVGIYAQAVKTALPNLPTEENGRLNDEILRENFITRVYAYWHWQQLLGKGKSGAPEPSALLDYHSRNKYLLLAHSTEIYSELGKLLADLQAQPLAHIAEQYIQQFMHALSKPASRGQHTNVLQHIQGYFKKQLNIDQKKRLSQVIEQYRQQQVPLMAPITLLNHYLAEFPNDYLAQQSYLQPFPETLNLRYSL